jgi:hypothetical protein
MRIAHIMGHQTTVRGQIPEKLATVSGYFLPGFGKLLKKVGIFYTQTLLVRNIMLNNTQSMLINK